ncbi:MAG: ABC transporter ATP-binding protein [Thermoanaerobaculales bacterium]|jgi:lipopolysaccharide transport system ATP-binding protein|nr:ABC transporter ATP-binding protein [Thermoanaerobaculales bacterium]
MGSAREEVVIRAEGLGKRYQIGRSTAAYGTLRDTIADLAAAPIRALGRLRKARASSRQPRTIWALNDINLEVCQGEVLGVIGRNGAGKTTLLKILSRITEPSAGRVELRGRVGSLLEVGTGFHPELTGRENILLNGAILGMRRSEILRKFDEIVSFAEIGQFLDTPVKRYSSGMYVRLAFAVAAHLEPEILLIDEVLAVGDLAFQRRCLGKVGEAARGGRTVLFVSHNMAAVENLCTRCVLINGGQIVCDGSPTEVISAYVRSQEQQLKTGIDETARRSGSGRLVFTSFGVETIQGTAVPLVRSGEDVVLVFGYRKNGSAKVNNVDLGIAFYTEHGHPLTVLCSSYTGKTYSVDSTTGEFRCVIENLPLAAGRYVVGGRLLIGTEEADWPTDGVGLLEVERGDFFGTGHSGFDGHAPLLLDGHFLDLP